MNSIEERIALLTVRIQDLAAQQHVFNAKLQELTRELELLKAQAATGMAADQSVAEESKPVPGLSQQPVTMAADLLPPVKPPVQPAQPVQPDNKVQPQQQAAAATSARPATAPAKNTSVEEFLGKNLASKVGILVTVVGIFIGAKYALEHDLISERVRIILGYLSGAVLAGIGYKLRRKYPAYSAVLMGGGLCVGYFITYIAFSYYQLFPRMVAFAIMVGITGLIVYASMLYNRVIVAHLAQVGAYAIPFLLSDNSGNYLALFSYIAIINTGMVVISFKKNWKSLVYAAFGTTWLVFVSWFAIIDYSPSFISSAWIFLWVFFALFYTSLLAYQMVRKVRSNMGDLIVLPINAFIFYILGMILLLHDHFTALQCGGFTLLNAIIHFGVAMFTKKLMVEKDPLYGLLIGLTVTFVMIAVPVAFDGKAVPLLWTAQAVILYILGRQQKSLLYLSFSIALSVPGMLSLAIYYSMDLFEWGLANKGRVRPAAFLNESFITAIPVIGAFCVLIWLHRTKYKNAETGRNGLVHAFYDVLLPLFTIIAAYCVFFAEIGRWFGNIQQAFKGADDSFGPWAMEVSNTRSLALTLYSFVFVFILVAMNHRWFRKDAIRISGFGLFILLLVIWIFNVLPLLNEQAVNYYQQAQTGLYFGSWNLLSRYAFLLPIAGLLYYHQPRFAIESYRKTMSVIWPQMLVVILIVFLSFEYLLWTKVSGANNQYKYGLSILWGLFALALIVYGIWKKHRGLRLTAMVMLVITLVKLVLFDLSHANTLTRTITYIALGGILLLVSYLYNRYKVLLFGEDEQPG